MSERYTAEARAALVRASDHAVRGNHCCVGTTHLLVALASSPGKAGEALRQAGVIISEDSADHRFGHRGEGAEGNPPFSPACKRVLTAALSEAIRLKQEENLTEEHLLLGLLSERQGAALRIIADCGTDVTKLRETVLSSLGADEHSPDRTDWRAGPLGRVMTAARRATPRGRDVGVLEVLREIARTQEDPVPREMFRWLLLDAESFDRGVYLVQDGLGEETELAEHVIERACDLWDTSTPNLLEVVHAAVTPPAPALSRMLKLEGLSPLEVAADAATASNERREWASADERSTAVWAGVNLLLGVLLTALVIRTASQSGWWKLLMVLPLWSGYPGSGPVGGSVIASLLYLIVGPVAAALQLAGVSAEVLQARSERKGAWAGSGARSLRLGQWRRHVQRRYARRGGRAGTIAAATLYRHAIPADIATGIRLFRAGRQVEKRHAAARTALPGMGIGIDAPTPANPEESAALAAAAELYHQVAIARPRDQTRLGAALGDKCYELWQLGLRPQALEANALVVDTFRRQFVADPTRDRHNLAHALSHRAALLWVLGRHLEAPEALSEAILHTRALAEGDLSCAEGLADLLKREANQLSELGRHDDAIESLEEAVGLLRPLSAAEPEKNFELLLGSLELLGKELLEARRPYDAISVLEEAVAARRAAIDETVRRGPATARLLLDLAEAHEDDGNHAGTVSALEEATVLNRMAAAEADSNNHDLANGLRRLSDALKHLGDLHGALDTIEQAVAARRVAARRIVTEPQNTIQRNLLASYLERKADCLTRLGQRVEALGVRREATQEWRELCAAGNDKYVGDLERSLNALRDHLRDDEALVEALEVAHEAIGVAKDRSNSDPEHRAVVAVQLREASWIQRTLELKRERVQSLKEEVSIYSGLVAQDDGFRGDLAESLFFLGAALHAVEEPDEALQAAEASVALSRELVAHDERYEFRFYMMLHNLAVYATAVGEIPRARSAIDEAMAVIGALVAKDRTRYLPELAHALDTQLAVERAEEDLDQALSTADEAVAVLEELAASGSTARASVAWWLEQKAELLRALGRDDEAERYESEAARDSR